MRLRTLAALTACAMLLAPADARAQRGGRGGPPPTPRAAAAVDLTGYWVSVITEDWKFRMVTPKKGVYETLTLNAEGRRIGDTWDAARDEAAGDQCRAYGAANIMRLPGRLHITWADDSTLKIETDAGSQTRLFRFGAGAPSGEPSGQGWSSAEWANAGRRGDVRRQSDCELRIGDNDPRHHLRMEDDLLDTCILVEKNPGPADLRAGTGGGRNRDHRGDAGGIGPRPPISNVLEIPQRPTLA